MRTPGVAVVWVEKTPADIFESRFSHGFCRKTTQKLFTRHLDVSAWQDPDQGNVLRPDRLLDHCTSHTLLVVSNPEIVVAPAAFRQMAKLLAKGCAAAFPVYNQTRTDEQMVWELPFPYLNLNTYLEVAELYQKPEQRALHKDFSGLDLSCVLFSVEQLRKCRQTAPALFEDCVPAADLAAALLDISRTAPDCGGYGVAGNALVHSFGDYYNALREDLVRLIPDTARDILDVGCARGGFGKKVRSLGRPVNLTGVEVNPAMVAEAKQWYDQVVCSPVESVGFKTRFDHINCGDVIEHLTDPWQTLKHLGELLRPGGTLAMSIPNAGHWTVVRDLAAGEFPYIPLGIQCITHLRWFTEASVREMIDEAGFFPELFELEQVPPTSEGQAFIDVMCAAGRGNRESLATNEFIVRIVRK